MQAGKANVRVGKYPGNSSDNSGLPATYTGPAEVIDPNDAAIVFNATANRWEISFDVRRLQWIHPADTHPRHCL